MTTPTLPHAGEARLFTPPFLAGCAAALCGLALYSHEQLRKLQAAMQPRIVSLVAAGVGAPLPSGRRPPSGLQRGPGAGRIRDPLSQRISPIRQQQRQKQHQGGAAAAPKLLQILPGGAGGGDCPPPLVAVH